MSKLIDTKRKLNIPTEGDPSFKWVAVAFLVLVELMFYTPAMFHGLVGSDYSLREVEGDSFASWRPLSSLAAKVLFTVYGEGGFAWHVSNILLHLVSVLLFFRIALDCAETLGRKSVLGPALTTVLFQIHPAAIQNVYRASGFSELLSMLLMLAATLVAVRAKGGQRISASVVTAAFFAAALLSNESALVYPILLLLVFIARGESIVGSMRSRGVLFGILLLMSLAAAWLPAPAGPVSANLWQGVALLIFPTDAFSVEFILSSMPVLGAAWGALLLLIGGIALQLKLFDLPSGLMSAAIILTALVVYLMTGELSSGSLYPLVGFAFVAACCLLMRKEWRKEESLTGRVLLASLLIYGGTLVFLSMSAVLNRHVANKFGRALRGSFVEYHSVVQQREYYFGALPAWIRDAEITGEGSVDFQAELRRFEMADTVGTVSILRIVILDRDDASANVDILRTSKVTLIVQTQSENQFFMVGASGNTRGVSVGQKLVEGRYSIEVLATAFDGRPTVVRISVDDPADLDKLLFYDDTERNFFSLETLQAGGDEEVEE